MPIVVVPNPQLQVNVANARDSEESGAVAWAGREFPCLGVGMMGLQKTTRPLKLFRAVATTVTTS